MAQGEGGVLLCYVPEFLEQLLPRLTGEAEAFREVESSARRLIERNDENEFCAHFCDSWGYCAQNESQFESSLQTARGAIWIKRKKRIRVNDLVALNQRITGQPTSLRKGRGWVGSPNASGAWYVAPPAETLGRYVTDFVQVIGKEDVPVTLRASVGLMQFLHLHPFLDGNGRCARSIFIGLCARPFGLDRRLSQVISRIWRNQGLELHSFSAEIRHGDDWNGWLRFCREVLRESFHQGS